MKTVVSDELWERIEPLLPPEPVRRVRFPGRKRLDSRQVLTGILFVLKTGIAWDDLPAELGCGCGKTCRQRLRDWHAAGVWLKLHALLLAELNAADTLDWERALIDASFAKAPEGDDETGPNPTDRGKSGSQPHLLTDGNGVPLTVITTAANVNEVTQVFETLDALEPVGGKPGPNRTQPKRLHADRGYDSEPVRQKLRERGITPMIARRNTVHSNTVHGSGLGAWRWPVERTMAWYHAFGRLRRRLDRLPELQDAFGRLACALICLRLVLT